MNTNLNIDIHKIGQNLKEFCKENKLTQEKLTEFLNIGKGTIADYERGRYLIATPFLYQICKKYNISADYLLGKIDNPKYYYGKYLGFYFTKKALNSAYTNIIHIKLIANTTSVIAFKITPALLKPLIIFFLLLTPKHNPVILNGKTNITLEMIKEVLRV